MIYKICSRDEWNKAMEAGEYRGAPIDLEDGFIHFSTETQMKETAAKHFSGQRNLILVGFDEAIFGSSLRWEPSRGGALFPHLYDTIDSSVAHRVYDLPWNEQQQAHTFPSFDNR